MPPFLHFLIGWQIPEDLRHGRFGFKTWQHPELLAALDALAPETRLLSLIDEIIFADEPLGAGGMKVLGRKSPWQGTAEELERRLLNSSFEHEVRKLLSWPTACGTYLGRLEHSRKNRVRSDRSSAKRGWIIYPPDAAGVALPQAA